MKLNKLAKLTAISLIVLALLSLASIYGIRAWKGHTYTNRVKARLTLINQELSQFKELHDSHPTDPKMVAISTQLASNDSQVTSDLDQAKRLGVNVKPLAHDFCELLEDQAKAVKVGNILTTSNSNFAIVNRNAELIENSLTVAMMWE